MRADPATAGASQDATQGTDRTELGAGSARETLRRRDSAREIERGLREARR